MQLLLLWNQMKMEKAEISTVLIYFNTVLMANSSSTETTTIFPLQSNQLCRSPSKLISWKSTWKSTEENGFFDDAISAASLVGGALNSHFFPLVFVEIYCFSLFWYIEAHPSIREREKWSQVNWGGVVSFFSFGKCFPRTRHKFIFPDIKAFVRESLCLCFV